LAKLKSPVTKSILKMTEMLSKRIAGRYNGDWELR
jgi:hypothetical protein